MHIRCEVVRRQPDHGLDLVRVGVGAGPPGSPGVADADRMKQVGNEVRLPAWIRVYKGIPATPEIRSISIFSSRSIELQTPHPSPRWCWSHSL